MKKLLWTCLLAAPIFRCRRGRKLGAVSAARSRLARSTADLAGTSMRIVAAAVARPDPGIATGPTKRTSRPRRRLDASHTGLARTALGRSEPRQLSAHLHRARRCYQTIRI